jgi:hypothetical protein
MSRWIFWMFIGGGLYMMAGGDYPLVDQFLALWFLITCIAMPVGVIVWLVSKR